MCRVYHGLTAAATLSAAYPTTWPDRYAFNARSFRTTQHLFSAAPFGSWAGDRRGSHPRPEPGPPGIAALVAPNRYSSGTISIFVPIRGKARCNSFLNRAQSGDARMRACTAAKCALSAGCPVSGVRCRIYLLLSRPLSSRPVSRTSSSPLKLGHYLTAKAGYAHWRTAVPAISACGSSATLRIVPIRPSGGAGSPSTVISRPPALPVRIDTPGRYGTV